jgi:hypothetical protein
MQVKVGLCGKEVCTHICSRVCYCPLGLELSYHRLSVQRARRELRREILRAAGDQLEINIRKAAGPFEKFSRRLALERQRKGKENEQLERVS